jgi:hypothetical protein
MCCRRCFDKIGQANLVAVKKKIIKLENIPTSPFHLIGISSHENDYRLSWALNQQAGTNFKRTVNYIIFNKKENTEQEFNQYECFDASGFPGMYLISNSSPTGYLLPELKNIDFFIVLLGKTNSLVQGEVLQKLKKVDIVSLAMLIDTEGLKSKNKLVFNI